MAISNIIQSISTHITNAYTKLENKKAIIPQNKNIENLANAIDSITTNWGLSAEFSYKMGKSSYKADNVNLPKLSGTTTITQQ